MKETVVTRGVITDQFANIYLKRIPTYSFPCLLDVMANLGVPNDAILRNTGLDVGSIAKESTLISFLQAYKIVRNVMRNSPREDIGLYLGSFTNIGTYGVLGYAMMACATWGEALLFGQKYYRVASSLMGISVTTNKARGRLIFTATPFYPELADIEAFTTEKLFSGLIGASRSVLPSPVYPCAARLAYPEPSYANAYRAIFRCPVTFDETENSFEYELTSMQRALTTANKVCTEFGKKVCEEYLHRYELQHKQPLGRKVASILLATPRCAADMAQVADKLCISSRTLRRQLETEGTNFQAIDDEVRFDLASHYLRTSQLSLDDIAYLVGFTEGTNFRRAFKRWSGVTPACYRRQALKPL